MGALLALLGILGFFIGLVLLVLGFIKKKKTKGGPVLGISIIVFVIGFIMVPTDSSESANDSKDSAKVETSTKPKEGKLEEETNNSKLDYAIEEERVDGSIWYVTLVTPLTEEKDLRKLVESTSDLAKNKKEKIDSIFVRVNIKDSLAKSYAADGKVALSNKGRAQTGLDKIGVYEFDYKVKEEHLTTKADLQQSTAPYSAEDILKAFQSAGLSTPEPRDNSHNCVSLECTTVITTEAVSIYEWPSEEKAKEVQGKSFGTYQAGTIIIRMNDKSLDAQPYISAVDSIVK